MRSNIDTNTHPNIGAAGDGDIDARPSGNSHSDTAPRLHHTNSNSDPNVVASVERDGATSNLHIVGDLQW